jgi:hypothetical protein
VTGLVCITNDMQRDAGPRPWACTVRDEHLETCANAECWGCFPRPAEFGCLCLHCFQKADDTVRRVGAMILHLRSIENGGQALGEKVATSRNPRLPLPQSWLSADELLVALGAPPIPSTATLEDTRDLVDAVLADWSDLRGRVSSEDGARSAVTATLLLQKALHRWPNAEAERRAIPRPIRCTNCSSLALYRHAPLDYLGDLFVQCAVCGDRRDWWEWADRAKELAGAVEAARKAEEKQRREARKEKRPA